MGKSLISIGTWLNKAKPGNATAKVMFSGFFAAMLLTAYAVHSRPHYALLYTGLDAAEKGVVVEAIQTMGISVYCSKTGDVEVPEDRISEVRMRLVASAKLPHFEASTKPINTAGQKG